MSLTEGEGVDIVLNSLSGDAIDKSFSVLRAGGRFIEIGKSDIYANRKIGMRPLRKNVSVFVVDLLGLVEQRPAFASAMFREVMTRFDGVDVHPLAYRVFPVARVVDAFRDMAQSKHVGKLIVSMRDRAGVPVERRSALCGRVRPMAATSSPAVSEASDWRWPVISFAAAPAVLRWSGAALLRRRRMPRSRNCAAAASRYGFSRPMSPIASRCVRSSRPFNASWGRCAASCMPRWYWTMRRWSG